MRRKLIFLAVFVPAFSVATVLLVHFFAVNYNASLAGPAEQVPHVVAMVLAWPLLRAFHAAGLPEESLLWLQLTLLGVYSLLLGAFILLIGGGIRRLYSGGPGNAGPHPQAT